MNWYKKAQPDYFEDFFQRKNIQRNLTNEEEKTENKTINLYRNFDASMDDVEKDQNGNLIFSPRKCEQGVLWFAHDLQSNPAQYYDRGEKYLLTYPLNIQYRYIERTYDNGDVIKEPISDWEAGLEDNSSWAGYNLPEGFKFSYKTQKHIICEKDLIVPQNYITEII